VNRTGSRAGGTTRGLRLLAVLAGTWVAGCATSGGPLGRERPTGSACSAVPLGPVRLERIAVWRDDARAAYSIVHDDMCSEGTEGIDDLALPALRRRGLRVGVAPIAGMCEQRRRWPEVLRARTQGHEIVSHSYTHARVTPENAADEVGKAKQILERRGRGPVDFYVFPYDEFSPETVSLVEAAGHLGARAGNRGATNGLDRPPINPADATGDFAVLFDVWPRPYSKYSLYKGIDLLNVQVWDAIERGGWAMRELHGVMRDHDAPEKNGFGPIPLSVYEKHLDFLEDARRANVVWTDTPSAIIRYRHARRSCRAAIQDAYVVFDPSAPECIRFATPISVVVASRADLPGLKATQRGAAVPVLRLGPGRFSVTADPTRGPVALAGCGEAGRTVDTTVSLTPRPQPARSVCEVETVRGADARMLDDFERRSPEFDAGDLPGWTFYPGAAALTRQAEGAAVLGRFAGRALGTWSGATFVFSGPDGAGACYDARAHTGLRFRLRGRVESPDELSGKAVVSLVTAETRAQVFGGDLKGEGGHFHALVNVTPDWQTVEIPWSALRKPTWGDTVGLEAPALGKLQAVDWGVTASATAFELDLDDIELY
jgi:peptidoglycan/xylan/chitin deacetylase (PgdA/CDA1 family)